jgi:hypothetical protein
VERPVRAGSGFGVRVWRESGPLRGLLPNATLGVRSG